MKLPIERVEANAMFEKGIIVIGSQGSWYRPYHAAVVEEKAGQDMVGVLHATTANQGPVTSPASDQGAEFFTQKGVVAFKISNPDLNENFIAELEKTDLNFKVSKSVTSYIKDFFYSAARFFGSAAQEEAVAESIAKYFFKNHASIANPDKSESKMYCSQFVYQSMQNATMIETVGEKNLGLNQRGLITETFEDWRSKHIEQIRGAVREFPEELRHISSAVSPKRLTGFLESLADKTQEREQGKSAHLPSDKPGFFSKIWQGVKSVFTSKPVEEQPLITTSTHSLDELGELHPEERMETAKKEAEMVVKQLRNQANAAEVIGALSKAVQDPSHNKGASR